MNCPLCVSSAANNEVASCRRQVGVHPLARAGLAFELAQPLHLRD